MLVGASKPDRRCEPERVERRAVRGGRGAAFVGRLGGSTWWGGGGAKNQKLKKQQKHHRKLQQKHHLKKKHYLVKQNQKEILLNSGRFGPYLKCENKSARIEAVEDIFTIGLNRAVTLIADAKPGRISSSIIKDLGEHPEDKKPVKVMKGKFGPYIKYKSLNATIPEEKDPHEITMDDALILIDKRKEYDRNKKKNKKKGNK